MQNAYQQIDNIPMFSLFDSGQEQETARPEAFYRARLIMLKRLYAKRQREKQEIAEAMR